MKKKALSLIIACYCAVFLSACGKNDYTLYFSLSNKNTGEQIMSLEDALVIGNKICQKYTSNHTQSSHFSDQTNDDGSLKCDQIVNYEIHDMSPEDMDALKAEFEKAFPETNITIYEN